MLRTDQNRFHKTRDADDAYWSGRRSMNPISSHFVRRVHRVLSVALVMQIANGSYRCHRCFELVFRGALSDGHQPKQALRA